jgi:hypothetical protein
MLAKQISGAEQIAQRLRGPILGDELLDIEIDRRRLDALAILHGREHAIEKRRLRLALAIFAAVDRGLMFRDRERALGKIEHLAFLDVGDFGSSDEPQWPHAHASCRSTRSRDRRLAETCRPCGPPARRLPCPKRCAGCRGCETSSATLRSKAAWNCSNCLAPTDAPPWELRLREASGQATESKDKIEAAGADNASGTSRPAYSISSLSTGSAARLTS